ncbi:MAG TPA: thioesterase family protein [Dongiaceae bacterium]|nr:thioesterase family protein [Dongiaceae bacterium]
MPQDSVTNLSLPIAAPFVSDHLHVLPAWIDGNGHMNVAYYLHAFDLAFDDVFKDLALGTEMMTAAKVSTFAAEMHITFQGEVFEGDRLRVTTQLVGLDNKRFQWFQMMYHAEKGYLAGTCEWMILFIDMTKRRVTEIPAATRARLEQVLAAHADLPRPPELGRNISLTNKRRSS